MTTKKTFGLIITSLFIANLSFGQAQPSTPQEHSQKNGKVMQMPRKMADAQTRADKMTKRLTQELGLDAATTQKLSALTLTRAQKIDEIQASASDNKEKNTLLKQNAENFETNLKSILTADQFSKYKGMKHGKGGDRGGRKDKDDNESN